MQQNQIIALIKSNTRDGFEFLYDHYSINLYNTIYDIVNDKMISEDLLQDTFVKIWKHIDLYDAGKGSLYTWMLNIAKNTSIDYKRSKQSTKQVRTARIYHSDINMSRFHILPDIDNIDLKSIVSKLDKKYSEVLNAMFWSGYNQDQAAKYLDLPLGTIKTRVRKGLQILRTQVSPA